MNSSFLATCAPRLGYMALRGVGVPVDLLVLTREEFERDLTVLASLPATVAREGRLFYAA